MSRARNIKPGFFENEDLAECTMAARLMFIGLWTIADRRGILEDRPKRIGAIVFPYERVNTEALLGELASRGFIRRYEAGGHRCILIPTFAKHQNPHVREQANSLPEPDEHHASTVQAPGTSGASTEQATLNDESLLHESPLLNDECGMGAKRAARSKQLPDDFDLSDERAAYAVGRGHSTAETAAMFEHFQNHHRAKGSTMKDWDAAWRTWVGNQKNFAARQPTANGHAPPGPRTFFTKAEEDAERARNPFFREATP